MKRPRTILFSLLALIVAAIAALALLDGTGEVKGAERDLGMVLVFSNPADCRTGEPLTRIVRELNRHDPGPYPDRAAAPIRVAGYAGPLRPRIARRFAVGRDAMGFVHYAILDLRGRWHGLRVAGLRSGTGESDLAVHFAEPADRVREVLVRNGFNLPAAGQWRQPDYTTDNPTPLIGIVAEDGGATLYCSN